MIAALQKPAIRFFATFVGCYLLLNTVYGLWITSMEPAPDGMTVWVARQTSAVVNALGAASTVQINTNEPTVSLLQNKRVIINIFEGCNGLNVMVVFLSFLLAFRGSWKSLAWFLPLGIIAIHVANLGRVGWLFQLSLHQHRYFYYVHKYLFTAIIYLVVFALWVVWVRMAKHKDNKATA
jgi:exosortase family protein XrtF